MENQQIPLVPLNGTATKPSRLPMPGTLSGKKRPMPPNLRDEVNKENADEVVVPVKRPKVAAVQKKPPAKPVSKRPVTATTGSRAPTISTNRTTSVAAKAKTASVARKPAQSKPTSATTKPAAKKAQGATGTRIGKAVSGATKEKRAAWDLKGRLQDVEEERKEEKKEWSKTVETLEHKIESCQNQMESLQSSKMEQGTTLKKKEEESSIASQRIQSLEAELQSERFKYSDQSQRLSALQMEHTSLQSKCSGLQLQLASAQDAMNQLTADTTTLRCQHNALKASHEEVMAEGLRKSGVIVQLEATVQRHLTTIAECEARWREDEMTRRVLHNTILELKGNIRVFCRVRPILPSELLDCSSQQKGGPESLDLAFPDDRDSKQIVLGYNSGQPTCTGGVAGAKSYNFEFDRVFGPDSTQKLVFEEISQLVQSALDGYNVCIFAYGQTGSGKTYTMEGPERNSRLTLMGGEEEERDGEEQCGMIPRAMQQVFESALSLKQQGWEYKMEASFLEIYNETIRDLLAPPSSTTKAPPTQQQHDIKLDPALPGGVFVTNVTPTPVRSQKQVAGLLRQAGKNRAVAATNCNERSSRSHSVFRLQLSGDNEVVGRKCKGSLNLVDLAGSERLVNSGSIGDRLKETKSINKSLSTLGQVILALANKDQHVPYRNSKLTYLLQNSLGGNSKTLMFVNMSPLAASFQETLCSLRFATKVNQCNIGTARKTTK